MGRLGCLVGCLGTPSGSSGARRAGGCGPRALLSPGCMAAPRGPGGSGAQCPGGAIPHGGPCQEGSGSGEVEDW
eukprot:7451875-Pyramimonas_sp.AAC.1